MVIHERCWPLAAQYAGLINDVVALVNLNNIPLNKEKMYLRHFFTASFSRCHEKPLPLKIVAYATAKASSQPM